MGGWICRGWLSLFGAPPFSVQRCHQNTYFKEFWDLWTENRRVPTMRNPNTTDPTPQFSAYSQPCDFLHKVFLRPSRVKYVRAKYFVLLRSEQWGESFGPGPSALISARTSAEHPAQKNFTLRLLFCS